MGKDRNIYELDGIKLGQFFQVKKQTEYEKLPLEDGYWIISKLIIPYVASMDSNHVTEPAFLAVWVDSSNWRDNNDIVKKISINQFNKMGDRIKLLTIGDGDE